MAGYTAVIRNVSSQPARTLREYFAAAGRLWCSAMHRDITWPVNGEYRCQQCGRVYRVPWEEEGSCSREPESGLELREEHARPARPLAA